MPEPGADTAARSLAHWSEAGRRGMDAFYAIATRDYRELRSAHDWAAELRGRARGGRVRLLDVACGSGRFPAALLEGGLAAAAGALEVDVDLLDPSPFSIAEARAVLAPPFRAAAELRIGLEELDPGGGPYDVAWAVHALYALRPRLLRDGLRRMHAVLRSGGLGAVAQAGSRSHYLRVYEAYRDAHAPEATPYTDAERVAEAIRAAAGAAPARRVIRYRTGTDDRRVAEGFLQRCLFDDRLDLGAMERPGPHGDALAAYLAGCRTGGGWRFDHEVHLLTWERAADG